MVVHLSEKKIKEDVKKIMKEVKENE